MLIRCERYPSLYIRDMGVRFINGEANVEDPDIIQRMSKMAGFGFVFSEPVDKPRARPARGDKGGEDGGQGQ